MGIGTRQGQEKQEDIWIATAVLARTPGHPFYQRLNELLDGEKFYEFVEELCGRFYVPRYALTIQLVQNIGHSKKPRDS